MNMISESNIRKKKNHYLADALSRIYEDRSSNDDIYLQDPTSKTYHIAAPLPNQFTLITTCNTSTEDNYSTISFETEDLAVQAIYTIEHPDRITNWNSIMQLSPSSKEEAFTMATTRL